MRLLGLVLVPLLLASRVRADLLSSVPALSALPGCAADCINSTAVVSTCPENNLICLCLSAPFQAALTECVASTCSVKQSLTTKNATFAACGVPIRNDAKAYRNSTTPVLVLAGAFFIVRILHRCVVLRSPLEDDDYMLIATLVMALATIFLNNFGVAAHGLGRDVWTVPFDDLYRFGRYFYAAAILYYVDLALAKITMLMFFMRIFPTRVARLLLLGTAVFCAVWGLLFALLTVFQCWPVSYYWTFWDGEHHGTCLSGNAIAWANAAVNIAVDLWMLFIPLVQLHSLRLHWKKKVGVGIMFCVGTFVTVVSILRLQSIIVFGKSTNTTRDNLNIDKWSTVEVCAAIICICLPSARLFLVHFFPRFFDSVKSGSAQAKSRFNLQSGTLRLGSTNDNTSRAAAAIDDRGDPISESRIRGNAKTTVTISTSRASDDDPRVSDAHAIHLQQLPPRQIYRHTSYTVNSHNDADYDDPEIAIAIPGRAVTGQPGGPRGATPSYFEPRQI